MTRIKEIEMLILKEEMKDRGYDFRLVQDLKEELKNLKKTLDKH